MPSYLVLGRYTHKGIEGIRGAPARLDAVKQAARQAEVEIKGFYLTMGHYDFAVIMDARDDAAIAGLMLGVAAQGYVRSETLRAFPEDEYRKIIAALS
jgi:uncharacterized protein with GYD domain